MMFENARARAKRKGIPFTITPDDVRAIWPKDNSCPVLGMKFARNKKAPGSNSASLDRMNSLWGYEPGNIAIISHAANRAKNTMTAAELEKISSWMRGRGLA